MTNVRESTAKMLEEDFQVDPQITESLFDFGFLDVAACRNELIKREFHQIGKRETKTNAKLRLSDKYCVSYSLVDKAVRDVL